MQSSSPRILAGFGGESPNVPHPEKRGGTDKPQAMGAEPVWGKWAKIKCTRYRGGTARGANERLVGPIRTLGIDALGCSM